MQSVAELDLERLSRLVSAADSSAFLVEPRVLRRVIRRDRKITSFGFTVPHHKSYVVSRHALLAIADKSELGLKPGAALPETVLLLIRPDPEDFKAVSAEVLLTRYWRLLLHAKVDSVLQRSRQGGILSATALRDRVNRIGQAEFDEIRAVLKQERYLLPPADDGVVYCEFVAVYAELRYLAPRLLGQYFPSIHDIHEVDRILEDDIHLKGLLDTSRIEGAPAPPLLHELDTFRDEDEAPADPRRFRYYIHDAMQMTARRNDVRSAIQLQRAVDAAAPKDRQTIQAHARESLDRLAQRLGEALGLSESRVAEWKTALWALLDQGVQGYRSPEARLMYDLQSACADHERDIHAIDVIDWILELGRRPLKRPLPSQREVLLCRHLKSAEQSLFACRLDLSQRNLLGDLLKQAIHRAETNLRGRFRPILRKALEQVGFVPTNPPEEVALAKMVEELLDRIIERGFLRNGDLRDAIARGNIKIPDLRSPMDFYLRDRLILADRILSVELDGVYLRADFYTRWLQAGTAVVFGTGIGRFITKYVLLPFGGAYVTLEGLQHMINPIIVYYGGQEVHLFNKWSEMITGIVFLGLIASEPMREKFFSVFKQAWWMFVTIFVTWPRRLIELPAIQHFLHSQWFVGAWNWLIKPIAFTFVIRGLEPALPVSVPDSLWTWLGLFAGSAVLLNSRSGRTGQEVVAEVLLRLWRALREGIFVGLFRFIMTVFRRLMGWIEERMYVVDEWLRYKSTDSRASLIYKPILGVVWFFVSYLVRFYFFVLVEPQINPIKHFPVVTVSAKLMIPYLVDLTRLIAAPLKPFMGPTTANFFAASTVFLLPGVFGFIFWELQETWRLFAANRRKRLSPIMIGSHGENVRQLLVWGIHSGTIPKWFSRLRRATRQAMRTQDWRACRRSRESLKHVAEAVERFFERELLATLELSKAWSGRRLAVHEISLASNRIRIPLIAPDLPTTETEIVVEEQSGYVVASLPTDAWMRQWPENCQRALDASFVGALKLMGVNIVRRQIDDWLKPLAATYDISSRGILVWPKDEPRVELVYPLTIGPQIEPEVRTLIDDSVKVGETFVGSATMSSFSIDLTSNRYPPLKRDQTLFSDTDVKWEEWVAVWSNATFEDGPAAPAGIRLYETGAANAK